MELHDLNDIYRDPILEHCRAPRNHDKLEKFQIESTGVNPFCGDEIRLQIKLNKDGHVSKVGLQSVGCSINIASGSILTEIIHDKNLTELLDIFQSVVVMTQGDTHESNQLESLGDATALYGVRKSPIRIKCALLSWNTMKEGVEKFQMDSK